MPGYYTKEESDRLHKQALIMLLMSMQDQLQQMNDSMNRLTEQIAAANQYRFGRHSKGSAVIDLQSVGVTSSHTKDCFCYKEII